MKKYFDAKVNNTVFEIIAGEYVAIRDKKAVLTTLLGSCVSVCLSDRMNGIFGINHFMLPGTFLERRPSCKGDPKYGTSATDLLINEMMKLGAERRYLQAKVFGAGKVLDSSILDVAAGNAEFIVKYLSALRIPVVASDLGKNYGRKILFFCQTGEVYVKKILDINSGYPDILRERSFYQWVRANNGGGGPIEKN